MSLVQPTPPRTIRELLRTSEPARGAPEPGPRFQLVPESIEGQAIVRQHNRQESSFGTIHKIELCATRRHPKVDPYGRIARTQVMVDGRTVRRPVLVKAEKCDRVIVPGRVDQCTRQLAPFIKAQTPMAKRTVETNTGARVEAFYACADRGYNTLVASEVLDLPKRNVKQFVSGHETRFTFHVPAKKPFGQSGLSYEQAVKIFERQRKDARAAARNGKPFFKRSPGIVINKRYTFIDKWGMPAYTLPLELKQNNSERYCPEKVAVPGCRRPVLRILARPGGTGLRPPLLLPGQRFMERSGYESPYSIRRG